MAINDNEMDIVKKIAIALIIISFGSSIFVYFTGGSLSVNCQAQQSCPLRQLNNTQRNISLAGNSLAGSFNAQLFPTNNTSTSYLNLLAYPVNFIYKIASFLYYIFIMLGLSVYVILFILFSLIPSLFNSGALGAFGYIFDVIYGFAMIVVAVVALNLIWKKVIPIISGLIGML